jgi:hypothetical protein
MSRKRLTEEQAIEKYGSIDRYHRHLANVKKYADSHKLEAKLYREHHLNDAIERSRKWRKEHIEEYKEKMRDSNRRRYREDPLFRQFVHARHYASITLDRLDLKRPDFLILHCFGPLGKTFMYLHKEEHCAIRRWIKDKKKCYFDVILEHPELISSAYVIEDGKLAMILRGTKKVDFEVKWPFHTKKSSVTCKTMLRKCRKGYSFAQKSALEAVKSLTLINPNGVEKEA